MTVYQVRGSEFYGFGDEPDCVGKFEDDRAYLKKEDAETRMETLKKEYQNYWLSIKKIRIF